MTRFTEPGVPGVDEHIWSCECHCCYLRACWDKDDPGFRFLWIEATGKHDRLRDRLRSATRIMRGKSAAHAEVVLDEPTVASLRAFLVDTSPS